VTWRPTRWLKAALAFAAVVGVIDTIGWTEWQRIINRLAVNPEAAVRRLAGDRLVSLPSVVVRARRLPTGRLAGLAPEATTAALTRLGRLQRRWMPADSAGFVNLSRQEFLLGRARESVEALGEALLRDPSSAFLHRLQALFLFSVGERTSAFAEMAVAEAIAPGLRKPVVDLSQEDEERLRLEGLRLRATFYPRKRTETSLALARELRIRGDESEARTLLDELRGRPEVEIELARWAVEEGDFGGAIEALMAVAARSSNPRGVRADAWSVIAVSRDLSGDGDGALAAAEAALDLDPKSPKPYITLAGLAQGRGDLEAALEYLRRAWGMDPANVRLLLRIASVAEQAGRAADALLALERAVEIEPGSPRIAALFVELQLRSGRYSEAATTLSRALDRHPTDDQLLRLADRLAREIGIR
jgi:tetratricopeptide (TPR) repeat protein